MSKERFAVDVILKMAKEYGDLTLKKINLETYGISRTTAWRCLRELEKAGYIEKAVIKNIIKNKIYGEKSWQLTYGEKSWRLTEQFKGMLIQVKIKNEQEFYTELDRVLTFNDEKFQQYVRDRVHNIIKAYNQMEVKR